MKARDITYIALMAAVLCIISPFSIVIPLSPVPISLSVFAVFLTAYIFGTKRALIACGIYVLLGLLGLPVFSGFSGGLARLAGPTGGYIIGYFPMIAVSGLLISKSRGRMTQLLAMLAGLLCCYGLGTVWLCVESGTGIVEGLTLAVLPFIPADLAKIAAVLLIGGKIRKRTELYY